MTKQILRFLSTNFILVALMLFIIPSLDVHAGSSVHIPNRAKIYKGHAYALYNIDSGYSWSQAETYCESLGGHLVTITSAGEEVFVLDLTKKIPHRIENLTNDCNYAYTGGRYTAGKAQWVTKEKWTYKQNLKPTSENPILGIQNGRLSNYNISTIYKAFYFVCEWDTDTSLVLPDQVTNVNVKKVSSTAVTVSWKKIKDAKGYMVYMKSGSNGTYKKIKDITSNSTTSLYKSKLKKGQTYYFVIRAYKDIFGERSYGDLSVPVKIKLK